MGRTFKKIYKYTPLGWLTKGYKKLGWDTPDDMMNEYLGSKSDGAIALQLAFGLLGGVAPQIDAANAAKTGKETSAMQDLFKNASPYAYNIMQGNSQNAYNAAQTELAYQRQNEFYNSHLSMPAKVKEYQDAGLNPMGLASAGVGATSAPSVQQAAPAVDLATSLVPSLLEYRAKMRELDIQEKAVNADVGYKASLVNVNEATVGKIFAEKDKISAEAFILQIQGKYADEKEKAVVDNLLKDLDIKDAEISKKDAETALVWLQAEWLPKLNESQVKLNDASARAANARAAVDEFERQYMDSHDGMHAPSGEVAAIATMLMNATTEGTATNGLVDTLTNPLGEHSPIGGTVRTLKQLFTRKRK